MHPLQRDEQGRPSVRLEARGVHEVVVLVDKLDRATLQAISYGLELGATTVRAVHAAADPDRAPVLAERWAELQAPVPLDVIECWDRDVPRARRALRGRARLADGNEVTAVMPRRDYPRLRQRLLHDRTSRQDPARAGAVRARRRRRHPVTTSRAPTRRRSAPPAAGAIDTRSPVP